MTPRFVVAPLAGSFFRPPAQQLLAVLTQDAALVLQPEDDNPWDESAVKVLLPLASVPAAAHEALREALPAAGKDWDELLAVGEPVHLGYVAKNGGKPLALAQAQDPALVGNQDLRAVVGRGGWAEVKATLAFTVEGKPAVRVVLPPGGQALADAPEPFW